MGTKHTISVGGENYSQDDFKVANEKGEQLCVSFVEPAYDEDRPGGKDGLMPCVIYMHGNASNKSEGLSYIGKLLPKGITLCSFDFSGCGNSEGAWVTLGHKEKDDLKAIISYLYDNKRVSTIGLWGRSMGAVTSLFYC